MSYHDDFEDFCSDFYDEEQEVSPTIWIDVSSKQYLIEDMTTEHIENAKRYLEKLYPKLDNSRKRKGNLDFQSAFTEELKRRNVKKYGRVFNKSKLSNNKVSTVPDTKIPQHMVKALYNASLYAQKSRENISLFEEWVKETCGEDFTINRLRISCGFSDSTDALTEIESGGDVDIEELERVINLLNKKKR